jgi:serine/threonine protein phosphatase PrpC
MQKVEPGEPTLAADSVVRAPQEPISLTQRVHSEARSRRWRACGQETQASYEVLFLGAQENGGPLLEAEGDEVDICGWECARGQHGPWRALIFREDKLHPLAQEIAPPALGKPAQEHRMAVALALGELFEMLHVLGEVAVIHSELEAFALRADRETPEAVMRWPELLYPLDALPEPGSFSSTGLDAPEVTGLVVRPVDRRADIYSLGVLIWSLFTGLKPVPGQERFLQRLPSLRAFDPEIPLGVEGCLRKAMSRLPEHRFETVTDFMQELRQAWSWGQRRRVEGLDQRLPVRWARATDIGQGKWRRQPNNQDESLAIWDEVAAWGLFAVLDGVSQSEIGSGDLASWAGRQSLEAQWSTKRGTPIFGQRFEGPSAFPGKLIETMARRAHEHVVHWTCILARQHSHQRPTMTACSTLSMVGLFGDRAVICSLGDSPIYLCSLDAQGQRQIERLTFAHTLSVEACRRGLPMTTALGLHRGSALSEALGRVSWDEDGPRAAEVSPACLSLRLVPGDILVLSTDGVPDALGQQAEHVILQTVEEHLGEAVSEGALLDASRALLRQANEQGARDNLTVLLVALPSQAAEQGE